MLVDGSRGTRRRKSAEMWVKVISSDENDSVLTLYRSLQNPALVQALSHPLRAKMLYELQENEASPKELAAHFGVPLSNVAYHIQILRKLKLIRLVRKTPRRGAIEHHYKADYGAHIDDEAWSQTPRLIRERMTANLLEDIGSSVTKAAASGGFDRSNSHLTRSRLVLDGQAWDVLAERLEELWKFATQLHEESEKRLKRANHEDERRAGLVMMLFESMPAVPGADEAAGASPEGHEPQPLPERTAG
jgi:DNA-binding transcriptional ArsR family regulator